MSFDPGFLAGDPLTHINEVVRQLLLEKGWIFVESGKHLFRALAVILICWTGIEAALSGRGFDFAKFARLILVLSFGWAMVRFYATPIPGLGYSFIGLITEQTRHMTEALASTATDDAFKRVWEFWDLLPWPTAAMLLPAKLIGYLAICLGLGLYILAVFLVTAYGQVALGVCLLLGPWFVPWLIVPKMDWLFWGWLKATLQFAFYQVVAAASLLVFSRLLVYLLDVERIATPTQLITHWPFVAISCLVCAFGIMKVPQLTSSMFSGSGGGDSGLLQSAAAGATGAAKAAAMGL